MAIGGLSVIVAILLIAVYLLYVVLPMFLPASMERAQSYATPGGEMAETLYYALEEQREIGLRITRDGRAVFFQAATGEVIEQLNVLGGSPAPVTAFAAGDPAQATLALGLADGTVQVFRHVYRVSYPGGIRVIDPDIEFPARNEPIVLDPRGSPIVRLAVESSDDQTTLVGLTGDRRLLLLNIALERNFLSDELTVERIESELPLASAAATHLAIDKEQRALYVAAQDGSISYFDISDKRNPRLVQRVKAVPDDVTITSLGFLSGGVSLLVGDSRGQIAQWFPVRDAQNNYTVQKVRVFDAQRAPIIAIAPEYYRKGFVAGDAAGYVGIYHATAHRMVLHEKIADRPIRALAITPRADGLLAQSEGGPLQFWHVHNPHPEVSWRSLWGKVWYESRQGPEWIWQSSSAKSDFEPKFSLTPLAFGTLKAAFYAMLFSIPLAILGAMYTAYFMAPRIRAIVKPTIEIMEALPTVILGFLAGLWFAPFVEQHLPGIFLVLVLLPVAMLVAAYAWRRLPQALRQRVPDGWEAVLLVPVIILATWLALALSAPLEVWLFDGNLPLWLSRELGIPYDQRNSLVVGIAMGFAVIPNIFSISEDALYGVPRHLITGSLALGATPWQTMVRIVLLTASPGIFSAVMIGLGRAVGETMIVVMATGNTPIVDFNIFQGFRALSANIAVEMPETEVNSTHYRILFLAGLVLFVATFFFNTLAEVVRQRLRAKYSSL